MPRPISPNDCSEENEPCHEDWMAVRFARREIDAGRLQSATTTLRGVLRSTPDFGLARALLGHCLLRNQHERRALRHFDQVEDLTDIPLNLIADYAVLLGRFGRTADQESVIHGTSLRDSWITSGGESRQSEILRRFNSRAFDQGLASVYHHVPFCGGTSINSGLSRMYGRSLVVVSRSAGRQELPLLLQRLESTTPPKMIRLHHPYPLNRHGDFRWFTVLRDPFSRFVSGYRKRLDPKILPTRDFAGRPSLDATIKNAEDSGLNDLMARELAVLTPEISARFAEWNERSLRSRVTFEEDLHYVEATSGLSRDELYRLSRFAVDEMFSFVGLTEELEASYLAMFGLLGHRAVPALTNRGRSLARDTPSDAQAARIRRLHEVDLAIYEHVRVRFQEDLVDGRGVDVR